MKLFTNRFVRGIVAAAAVVVSAGLLGCAAQRLNDDGMKMVSAGQREEGLALLARASDMEPGNSRYRIDYLEQQQVAVRDLLLRADRARNSGDAAAARDLYLAALRIDGVNELARRGLAALEMDERHRVTVADADRMFKAGDAVGARAKVRQVLIEDASYGPAQQLLTQMKDAADRAEDAKRAQIAAASVMKKPVTLQFRDANVRMVFEALSRTTGLNVIFDRDVRADLKTTIFVREATVDDTVDLILLQNQLEKKVLNAEGIPGAQSSHVPDLQCGCEVFAKRVEDRAQDQGHRP